MHRLLLLCVLTATAHADDERMHLEIGGGVAMAEQPAWNLRFNEISEVSAGKGDAIVYGATAGYDYWRGADGAGFHIPMAAFAGARVGRVTSTIGAGCGVLALETHHGQDGIGIVPQALATLGFALDDTSDVMFDARLERHVLAGADDFTTWSVLVMIGKTIGH